MIRSLLRDVSFAYVRRYERYERATARGDVDRADEALAGIQAIEHSIAVIERDRSWREEGKGKG